MYTQLQNLSQSLRLDFANTSEKKRSRSATDLYYYIIQLRHVGNRCENRLSFECYFIWVIKQCLLPRHVLKKDRRRTETMSAPILFPSVFIQRGRSLHILFLDHLLRQQFVLTFFHNFSAFVWGTVRQDSSVGILNSFLLDDWCSILGRWRDISLYYDVQTGSRAHLGSFPVSRSTEINRHFHPTEVKNICGYTSTWRYVFCPLSSSN